MNNRKYVIVRAENTNQLVGAVNEYIDDGYIPVGGPFNLYEPLDVTYPQGVGQAMFKPQVVGIKT